MRYQTRRFGLLTAAALAFGALALATRAQLTNIAPELAGWAPPGQVHSSGLGSNRTQTVRQAQWDTARPYMDVWQFYVDKFGIKGANTAVDAAFEKGSGNMTGVPEPLPDNPFMTNFASAEMRETVFFQRTARYSVTVVLCQRKGDADTHVLLNYAAN